MQLLQFRLISDCQNKTTMRILYMMHKMTVGIHTNNILMRVRVLICNAGTHVTLRTHYLHVKARGEYVQASE